MPYLHIHVGKQIQTINAKARGVVAIGNNAKGFISIGFISAGLVSLGLLTNGARSRPRLRGHDRASEEV